MIFPSRKLLRNHTGLYCKTKRPEDELPCICSENGWAFLYSHALQNKIFRHSKNTLKLLQAFFSFTLCISQKAREIQSETVHKFF